MVQTEKTYMQEAIDTLRYSFVRPWKTGRFVVHAHIRLWRTSFWDVWHAMPFDKKLAWMAFISQTVGIMTLIEIIFLKK